MCGATTTPSPSPTPAGVSSDLGLQYCWCKSGTPGCSCTVTYGSGVTSGSSRRLTTATVVAVALGFRFCLLQPSSVLLWGVCEQMWCRLSTVQVDLAINGASVTAYPAYFPCYVVYPTQCNVFTNCTGQYPLDVSSYVTTNSLAVRIGVCNFRVVVGDLGPLFIRF